MDKYDIEACMSDSYRSLVNSLIKKYGLVPYDYFVDEACKTTNKKNSRASEGLQIHHIDENKAIMLSSPEYAKDAPFKYQEASRLVYCNLIEHLILHFKITEATLERTKPSHILFGLGGAVNYLIPQINDYYSGKIDKKNKLYAVLDGNFDSYISILRDFLNLGFEYYWVEKKITRAKLSRGTDGKIVKEIYDMLEHF